MARDLIHNERTKLLANAPDRASTAALAVGVLGPLVTFAYGTGVPTGAAPLPLLVAGTILWMTIAGLFHLLARYVLGRLR